MKKIFLVSAVFMICLVFTGCGEKQLQWSEKSSQKTMNWSDALEYCQNLNEGGHKDWRLPTISELRTLIKDCSTTQTGGKCGVTDSCLSWSECDKNTCYGCAPLGSYSLYSKLGDTRLWSSSLRSDSAGKAWHVTFMDGAVGSNPVDKLFHVRCVR